MIRQTKLESIIESTLNTLSGMAIALLLTCLFNYFPNSILYLGDGLTGKEVVGWTTLMTVVSVARSYIWRRFFNAQIHKQIHEVISKWKRNNII